MSLYFALVYLNKERGKERRNTGRREGEMRERMWQGQRERR